MQDEGQQDKGENPTRWIMDIQSALSASKKWREEAKKIEKRYRGEKQSDYAQGTQYQKRSGNEHNILWSNVRFLLPAIFKRAPKPICRPSNVSRQSKDNSPEYAAAQVLERAIFQLMKDYDFKRPLKQVTLDVLLSGRGTARVRYDAVFEKKETSFEIEVNGQEVLDAESVDELAYEESYCEFVYWDDFIHGPGDRWEQVPWVGFRHKLTRSELVEKFGDIGKRVPLNCKASLSDAQRETLSSLEQAHDLDQTEVYEIWDKSSREVFFVCLDFKDQFIKKESDPLNLYDFFPCPRPAYFVDCNSTLIPVPEFTMYCHYADDLERVVRRISKIVNAIRARGVYDATLGDLHEMLTSDDGSMTAVKNGARFAEMGGFDRAIWMYPVDKLIVVMRELIAYKAHLIQSIYEVTGISDIMRGSTSDIETARAQEIKANFGSLPLQDRQEEMQRFARDLIRLQAEIIAEHFSIDTLKAMTDLDYPTNEQKMMAMQAYQMIIASGQENPRMKQLQEVLEKPTWEEIKEVLSTDVLRRFSVEIETDSTLHNDMVSEKGEIIELLSSITQFIAQSGPLVQQGLLPVDAAKQLLMAGVRRFKLGTEVEEALDQIGETEAQGQQGPSQAEIEVQKQQQDFKQKMELMQAQMQMEREKHQMEMQKIQAQARAEQVKQAAQMQDKLATGMN